MSFIKNFKEEDKDFKENVRRRTMDFSAQEKFEKASEENTRSSSFGTTSSTSIDEQSQLSENTSTPANVVNQVIEGVGQNEVPESSNIRLASASNQSAIEEQTPAQNVDTTDGSASNNIENINKEEISNDAIEVNKGIILKDDIETKEGTISDNLIETNPNNIASDTAETNQTSIVEEVNQSARVVEELTQESATELNNEITPNDLEKENNKDPPISVQETSQEALIVALIVEDIGETQENNPNTFNEVKEVIVQNIVEEPKQEAVAPLNIENIPQSFNETIEEFPKISNVEITQQLNDKPSTSIDESQNNLESPSKKPQEDFAKVQSAPKFVVEEPITQDSVVKEPTAQELTIQELVAPKSIEQEFIIKQSTKEENNAQELVEQTSTTPMVVTQETIPQELIVQEYIPQKPIVQDLLENESIIPIQDSMQLSTNQIEKGSFILEPNTKEPIVQELSVKENDSNPIIKEPIIEDQQLIGTSGEVHKEEEKEAESNVFEGALSSWWPTNSDVEEEDSSESWWPTDPVVIESIDAKSPSESAVIDWSFLDNEYPDPLPPPVDNKEVQVEEISKEPVSEIMDINIGLLPRSSVSNIPNLQSNIQSNLQSDVPPVEQQKPDVESQKVQSRRGSLSVIETIKEMTTAKTEDPEDAPDFLERNPTWEDSLEPINIHETVKEEQETEEGKLQKAFEAMANADGGVYITKLDTIAQKRWKNAYLTLKRLLALRKLERTSRVGPGAELAGYSLGMFSPKHPMRKLIFKYMFCQRFEYLLLILITTHLIILIERATAATAFSMEDELVNVDIAITVLYTIECALRIFTLGFIKGPHSYLQNAYNKLDFVIVIDSWVHIYMAIHDKDGFFRFASLRAFRAVLAVRHFSFFANVIAIMDACQGSLAPLGNVFFFIAMVFSFYALVGVHFFGGKLKSRCTRKTDGQLPFIQEFCGTKGSTCDDNTTIVSYLSTFCVKGLVCEGNLTIPNASPGLQVCNESYGNPNYGVTNYDAFPQAILLLFQIVSFEGWAVQMYSMSDSVGVNADIYYVIMVIIGSYFAVNVCVAAISGVFIRVRHEHQVLLKKHKREQAFTFHNAIKLANVLKDVIKKDDAKLSWFGQMRKQTGMFNRNVSKFIRQRTKQFASMSFRGQSFLKRSFSRGSSFGGVHHSDSEIEDDEDDYGSFKSSKSFKSNKSFSRSLSRSLSHNTKSFNRSLSRNTRQTARHLNSALVGLVRSRLFRHLELLLITINFVILCCNTATMSPETEDIIKHASIALQIAFVIEMSLRAMAYGFRRYFRDVMNILDIIVVVVSFLGVTSGKWANISAIRLLRFFHDPKQQRFGKSDETPSPLALCIRSFNILGSLAFFYMIITIVFSIISMELYSGQFNLFEDGIPRENYDTFLSAMLTWFTVSTGESWINQLWNAMHPRVRYRWISPYLFIIYFILTTYVLINLIIAVILEQTELTDSQKKQIQKREYLKFLRATHSHAKSLRTGDWVIGAVEGTQAKVDKIKRNLSIMRPVSKIVKRVNIPSQVHKTTPYIDVEKSSSSTIDIVPMLNEHQRESYIQKLEQNSINDPSKKAYSLDSTKHEGEGFRPARLSRPRSSAILQSILETPEKKKKTSFQQSQMLFDESPLMTNINNTSLRKERASLDPRLLSHPKTSIASFDSSNKSAMLRRSSYNPSSTPFDSPLGPYINRPRRPSKSATQLFVGTGFANTTTHQDFIEEKTALQSAMLALAHNLSSPTKGGEFASIDHLQELQTPMSNSSNLSTSNEDIVDKYEDKKVEKSVSKPKQDLFHSLSMRGSSKRISFKLEDYEGLDIKYRDVPWYFSDESLFIFKSNGPTRRFLVFVVENIWYKRLIMTCAVIAVYIATQLNIAGFIDNVSVDLMDRFLLFTWTFDVTLKSIAYGVIFTPEAYLGDPFNIIDVVNMFFQWVGFNPPSEAYSRIVHIMNTIRGTRFIPRIQGLRILVSTMLHTMPAVASMFGFILVIYFIFATIGIQMFKNRFAACTDLLVSNRAQCVGTFVNEVGLRSQRVWMNPRLHFDHFGAAMLSLFVCSTTDSWIQDFLHTSEDIPDKLYDNPDVNNKTYNSTFFIIFIVITNWLVIRLLIGVFIDQFGIISGSKLLTERQKLWRDMNRIAQSLKPKKLSTVPRDPLRRECYKLVHYSKWFRYIMVTIILANYCLFASQRYDGYTTTAMKSAEVGFVAIYWVEAIIKFIGNQFHDWYQDWWNVGELILVIGSTCCLYPAPGSLALNWGTIFYLLRIFRVIRFLPNLSELVHTVLVSLPSLIYVVELLVIWLIEFAMIFYQSFPYVKFGTCINKDVNFERFLPSFVFSFQATTLDNWSCVMLELMNEPPYCIASTGYHDSSCGISSSALAYFILIVYILAHIITNLFIAQIIDTITFGLLNEDAMITPKHLTNYQTLWAHDEYDPSCVGYIGLHKLKSFVYDLGTPLGRRHNAPAKWFRFIQYEVYNFHVFNKGIPFRNLLETLVLYKVGSQGLILALRIEREKQLRELFKRGAAIVIQSHVRRFLVQRGFLVSHPLEVVETFENEYEYEDEDEDQTERWKKKILARLKVLLITGR